MYLNVRENREGRGNKKGEIKGEHGLHKNNVMHLIAYPLCYSYSCRTPKYVIKQATEIHQPYYKPLDIKTHEYRYYVES